MQDCYEFFEWDAREIEILKSDSPENWILINFPQNFQVELFALQFKKMHFAINCIQSSNWVILQWCII